jgi:glycine oxidase
MAQHPDVLIVGGGVIGLTAAYVLAKQGWRVEVLEKGMLGMEASWAGAGIVPPGNPEHAASAYDRLRAVSSRQFAAFSKELLEVTGIDNGYRVCGGIEFLEADDRESVAAWTAEQVPFERLYGASLQEMESALSCQQLPGYYFPGMAQVRNPRHLQALIAACKSRGVALRSDTAVTAIECVEQQVVGIRLATGERRTAGHYVIAAGAWSERLLAPLGIRTGIHPVRGQIALLKTAKLMFRRILLTGKLYLVPRDDGHVLIGSTEEPEAGFVKETTADAINALLEFGRTLVPVLAKAEIAKCWAGLRPGSRDGLPSLGWVGDFRNLLLAAGHFRAGIQLSPATAIIISEVLAGKTPSIPLDDFRPGREPANPVRSAFRS